MKFMNVVLTVTLLLAKQEMNVNADTNSVNDAHKNNVNSDHFEEKGVKWNIDLNDMLNFKKHGSYSEYGNGKESDSVQDYEKNGRSLDVPNGDSSYDQSIGEYEGHYQNAKGSGEQDVGRVRGHEESVEPTGVKAVKASDTFKKHIQDYIIRYVMLLLQTVNLQDKKLTERGNEEYSANFELVIDAKDLAKLQNLSKNLNHRNILDHLYTIDSILSKGMYYREKYTFYDDLVVFKETWFTSKNSYLLLFPTVALFMMAFKNIFGFSYKFIVLVLLNGFILLEGTFIYLIKYKEAGIKDHVEKMQQMEMPQSCTMPRKSFFTKIQDWLFGDECLAYHKAMQMSRTDTVFPLESILRAYSYYLVEMPFEILGSAVTKFSVKLHEHLPPIIREMGQFTTQATLLAFIGLFVLFFCGFIIKFRFWGAEINFGFRQWIRSRRRYPEDEGPPEYHRIRDLPRAEIREMEKEYVQQPPDYLEEGTSSGSEVAKDRGNVERRQVEKSLVEESNGVEKLDEDVGSDNETSVSKKRNLSQDIKTVKKLLAELKPSE